MPAECTPGGSFRYRREATLETGGRTALTGSSSACPGEVQLPGAGLTGDGAAAGGHPRGAWEALPLGKTPQRSSVPGRQRELVHTLTIARPHKLPPKNLPVPAGTTSWLTSPPPSQSAWLRPPACLLQRMRSAPVGWGASGCLEDAGACWWAACFMRAMRADCHW